MHREGVSIVDTLRRQLFYTCFPQYIEETMRENKSRQYTNHSGSEAGTLLTLQHTATHCNTLQHTATHCNTLQHTAIKVDNTQITLDRRRVLCSHCNILQLDRRRVLCSHCNTLQHTATHCNTLQHTATAH